jgi:two-component system, response regulator
VKALNGSENVDILLVEDNRHDAELTMRALTKSELRNKLHWVEDGVEALDFVRCTGAYRGRDPNQFPKLILLDLKMPRLNGLDVVRELKSDERTRPIPVVVMTSSNQSRDITESYRLGVNGYVTKPIHFMDLAEAISQIAIYWLRVNQVP